MIHITQFLHVNPLPGQVYTQVFLHSTKTRILKKEYEYSPMESETIQWRSLDKNGLPYKEQRPRRSVRTYGIEPELLE